MRHGTCVACQERHPLGKMYYVRKGIHCPVCVDLMLKDPHVPVLPHELRALVDPTLCANCQADGSEELSLVGGVRLCAPCIEKVKHPAIPWSLAAFWASLLAVVVFSADRANRRADETRTLDRAEQAIAAQRVTEAQELLKNRPPSERATLLQIQLDLANDNVFSAHARKIGLTGRWVAGGLSRRTMDQLDLADMGVAEMASALRAIQEGKIGQAFAAISLARKHYPQSLEVKFRYLYIAGLYSFSRREYERYIQAHTVLGESRPDHVESILIHAAARAAHWSLTNDDSSKKRAEELLAAARLKSDTDEVRRYVRFVEDRLQTKRLVSFEEFERR